MARSFEGAKRDAQYVYSTQQKTFYCGCDYTIGVFGSGVSHTRCAYKPRKDSIRSHRIEWDHVMPAKRFGETLQCWKDGGRDSCRNDTKFKEMESDLYNIVPSIGEINNRKSSRGFGEIEGEDREYGACDFEVKDDIVEPDTHIRGDIARIYFYMSEKYNIPLTQEELELFKKWDFSDPVSNREIMRGYKIHSIQGNSNRFLD